MSRSNRFKAKPRQVKHTTLIVVEGHVEEAFVKYLKSLCGSGCGTRVTVKNAFGGSGDAVLEQAIKLNKGNGYDVVACWCDLDKAPIKKIIIAESRRRNIILLLSKPCVEGFLLVLLGSKVPNNSGECKRQMAVISKGRKLNDRNVLYSLFPFEFLEEKKNDLPVLKRLFQLIQNE